jgi:hypothetical protein
MLNFPFPSLAQEITGSDGSDGDGDESVAAPVLPCGGALVGDDGSAGGGDESVAAPKRKVPRPPAASAAAAAATAAAAPVAGLTADSAADAARSAGELERLRSARSAVLSEIAACATTTGSVLAQFRGQIQDFPPVEAVRIRSEPIAAHLLAQPSPAQPSHLLSYLLSQLPRAEPATPQCP